MTVETAPTSVTHTVDVAAPLEHVFDVFTVRMASWWDPTHHLLADTSEMIVEPRVGGTITDVNGDGERCTWARVLVFDRPSHFAFSWDINLRWELEPDPARCSEVHVSFSAVNDSLTRVVLEHRHLDRHGDGWESMRTAVGSADGWMLGLSRLAAAATAPASREPTFAFVAIHHPLPHRRKELLDAMLEMRALMASAPGFIDAQPWEDAHTDRILGISMWQSEEAFRAAVPAGVGIPTDEVPDTESRPRDIFLLHPYLGEGEGT